MFMSETSFILPPVLAISRAFSQKAPFAWGLLHVPLKIETLQIVPTANIK
jgi:hypothetical protein